jgi:signal transduction histidine kinase
VGNPLLFIGFSLEIAALGRLCQYRNTLEKVLLAWVLAGSLAFWILGSTPTLLVVVSGTVVAGIYATGGLALLWAKRISHLQRLTALLFLAFFPVLLVRVYFAMAGEIALLTLSKIQSVTFIVQFSLLLVGEIGFLLLLKEADDRVLQENEQRERQRHQVQSRFVDLLTHELRAALSVIKLSGSSLKQQLVEQPPEVTKRLSNINRAADSMSGMVDRCIQLEKLDQGAHSIDPVLCSVCDIFDDLRLRHDGTRLRITIPDDALLMADHHLLGIMLDNLIDNALKYALPNTAILISYSAVVIGSQIFGLIAVENSVAAGKAPAAEQMFVRFCRGPQAHEFSGTGLGLYLVRAFARLQGGDAEYQGSPEGKVIVSIRLPAAPIA